MTAMDWISLDGIPVHVSKYLDPDTAYLVNGELHAGSARVVARIINLINRPSRSIFKQRARLAKRRRIAARLAEVRERTLSYSPFNICCWYGRKAFADAVAIGGLGASWECPNCFEGT